MIGHRNVSETSYSTPEPVCMDIETIDRVAGRIGMTNAQSDVLELAANLLESGLAVS